MCDGVVVLFTVTGSQLVPPEGTARGWLLTNGLGGFAVSTVSGINIRRYHGLLIAALNPPVDRRLLLAKLEEKVYIDGREYSLFSSRTSGGYSGYGFHHLHEFHRFPLPRYIYRIEDVFIEKEIMMVQGENTVLVNYHILNANRRRVQLSIYPLTTCRDYHHTTRQNDWPFLCNISGRQAVVEAYQGAPELYLAIDNGELIRTRFWYFDVFYELEAERGLNAMEDLFCPVRFLVETDENHSFTIGASTRELALTGEWAAEHRTVELERIERLLRGVELEDRFMQVLTLAADDFLVYRRSTEEKSIIAGYPWFADWGRDAMLALPGLTLVTGRYDNARQIIANFIIHEKDGLLPNLFPDDAGPPSYNTVDASLWMFWTLYKYLEYTGDWELVREAYPHLQSIISNYKDGTWYNIGMDQDGLIAQGQEGMALTWMDACVEGQGVTPRRGKPVEINALWHFGLRFMAWLAPRCDDETGATVYQTLADEVRDSFNRVFWNERERCLYDLVEDYHEDAAVRCNQIIAVSLPIRLLSPERELAVVQKVWRELYTPFGLRSLSPVSESYQGVYAGNERERDRAYHQGTVWVWPWGHFVTAVNRLYGTYSGRQELIGRLLAPLLAHLDDQCMGSVAEIFDGDVPHRERGCFAQAWSVGEVLRVYVEEFLGHHPTYQISLNPSDQQR